MTLISSHDSIVTDNSELLVWAFLSGEAGRLGGTEDKFSASSMGLQTPGGGGDLSSGLDFRKMDPLGASGCKVSTVHSDPVKYA